MEIARSYMQQQHSAFVNISRAWGGRIVVITSDLGKLLAWLPEVEAWSQLLYRCRSLAARCLCCIALCCGFRDFLLELGELSLVQGHLCLVFFYDTLLPVFLCLVCGERVVIRVELIVDG